MYVSVRIFARKEESTLQITAGVIVRGATLTSLWQATSSTSIFSLNCVEQIGHSAEVLIPQPGAKLAEEYGRSLKMEASFPEPRYLPWLARGVAVARNCENVHHHIQRELYGVESDLIFLGDFKHAQVNGWILVTCETDELNFSRFLRFQNSLDCATQCKNRIRIRATYASYRV